MTENSNAYGGQTGFIDGSGRDCNNLESTSDVEVTGTTQLQIVITGRGVDLWIFQEKL